MNTRRVLATWYSTLLLSSVLCLGLLAQESTGQPEAAPSLSDAALPAVTDDTVFGGTSLYSLMKSGPGTFALNLSTVYVNAFTPIAVPCPATAGRGGFVRVKVAVSAQFWNVTTAAAMMKMDISGPGTLGPASEVNVASGTDPFWGEVHTMLMGETQHPCRFESDGDCAGACPCGDRVPWLRNDVRRCLQGVVLAAPFPSPHFSVFRIDHVPSS